MALILSLAGVDDDHVAREYELTDLGLLPLRPMIRDHLVNEPALKDNEEGTMNMIGAK